MSGWKSRIRKCFCREERWRNVCEFLIWFCEMFNSPNHDDGGESSEVKSQCPRLHMLSDPPRLCFHFRRVASYVRALSACMWSSVRRQVDLVEPRICWSCWRREGLAPRASAVSSRSLPGLHMLPLQAQETLKQKSSPRVHVHLREASGQEQQQLGTFV